MAKMNDDELKAMLLRIAQNSDETFRSVMALDKKVDLHIQKTEYELQKINELDEIQNKLLDKHIEGVNTLKKIHLDYAKITDIRLEELEKPRRIIMSTISSCIKIIVAIGSVCGAVAGMAKLFQWF